MPLSFDLRTQPFIPCLCQDGQVRELSLSDVLIGAHNLLELAGDTPLQTVAILRLLLAILYRAMPYYDYEEEKWVEWWRQETLPAAAVTGYLNVQEGFDLFHPTRPFMQVSGLETGDAKPVATLAFEAASGNNATLFDHRIDKSPKPSSSSQAARMLVTAQAFSVAGGQKTEVTINGKRLMRPNRRDSASWAGMNLFVSGATLRETLLLNMNPLSKKKRDVLPVWEQSDPLADVDTTLVRDVVDRYTWQSRLIKLLPDNAGLVAQVYITQGRAADNAAGSPIAVGDPMKVLTSDPKKGFLVKYLNADRAAWRDLQVYLAFGKAYKTSVLHFVGEHIRSQNQPDASLEQDTLYKLNVVGVVSDQAKVDLWRHDRMSLPAALLASDVLRGMVEAAIQEADKTSERLGKRIRNAATCFVGGGFHDGQRQVIPLANPNRKPDPKDVDRWAKVLDARPAFWARLETPFTLFVAELKTTEAAKAALNAWREVVRREADRVLSEACLQMGDSTRAMQAIVAAKSSLYQKKTKGGS